MINQTFFPTGLPYTRLGPYPVRSLDSPDRNSILNSGTTDL